MIILACWEVRKGVFPAQKGEKPYWFYRGLKTHRSPPVCFSRLSFPVLSLFHLSARKDGNVRKEENVTDVHNVENRPALGPYPLNVIKLINVAERGFPLINPF